AGCYKCQLDEQWFDLTKETLREALQITPINRNQAFAAPLSINGLVDFVNQLGYPKKHRLHQRPDSPLHLSNEEPVLGYLKFSAKGTKREIFDMPIPGRLITENIRAAPYYQEYQENVAKHRGFLAGETRSTQDFPAPRPAKPARPQEQLTSLLNPKGLNVASLATHASPEAVEESMKDAYALPKGPLSPVVIREPESGKYQPLPEVPGKGKAKVSEEQVAHDLLSLQKHKKTTPADQYIFQRRVSEPTASSFHDVSPYEVLGQSDSEEESEKTGSDTGAQAEGQARSNPDETFEGQAGSNPDETSKGQAGPNPVNAEARVQSTSSPVVHAGSDREHMDVDVANVSLQPSTEQLYEGFTATIYPNVQENLKLAVEEPVLLEEPASSSGTLSSLQHLSRDFTFGDQFLCDKPSDADKSVETEVESMVNKTMEERLDKHGARLHTLEQLDIPQQVSIAVSEVVTDAVDWAMQAPLRNRFRDLPEADMKEILHQRMWETDSYKSHEDYMHLFEALEKSINRDQSEELMHDLAEARKKRKKGRKSPKTPPGSPSHQPPPPPPPASPSGTP
nr:histone deacetylase 14 [Tanacetum cinerariifolium]